MKKTLWTISIFIMAATLFSCASASAGKKRDRPIYTGVTAIDVSNACLPDGCQTMCQNACDSIAGETCAGAFDVGAACLKAHPPKEAIADAAAMLEAMDKCLEDNQKEFEKDRCRFSHSALDHRFYKDADPKGGVCEETFKEYQDCLKKEAPEVASVGKCQGLFLEKFRTNKCTLATAGNVRRLIGYEDPAMVRCYLKCDKVL